LLRYHTIEDRYEDGSALTVRGSGEHEPGGYEIRAAGEWAELIAQATYAGRRGASWGLAVGWQDDSGDPCAHVQLERYGVAFTSRCTPESNLDDVVLTDEQLDQLYVWLDTLAPF